MRASVVFCAVFISTVTADKWRLKQQTSDWNFQTVRKHVNTSNIFHSVKQVSLIGCTDLCTNLDGIIVPSLFFHEETGHCMCNSAKDETSEDEREPKIIYGVRTKLNKVEIAEGSSPKTTVWPYKHDCSGLFDDLFTEDGVYSIHPPGGYVTDTWCDMTNGGWTVIQRRMDGSEKFYRGWDDYVTGFGNRNGEYWLGLENIHQLSRNRSELQIYIEAFKGVVPPPTTANYSDFKIGDSNSNYTLYTSGFSGMCGDSLSYHNENPFTTFDRDNDNCGGCNCAIAYNGAGWYNHCYRSQLNGRYFQGRENNTGNSKLYQTGIHWVYCWDYNHSLKISVMKIKQRS